MAKRLVSGQNNCFYKNEAGRTPLEQWCISFYPLWCIFSQNASVEVKRTRLWKIAPGCRNCRLTLENKMEDSEENNSRNKIQNSTPSIQFNWISSHKLDWESIKAKVADRSISERSYKIWKYSSGLSVSYCFMLGA